MSKQPKEPPPPPPSIEEANSRLRGKAGQVQQRLDQIDKDLLKYKNEMKKNPRNNMAKQRCLNLLKQKKTFENQLMMMDNQSFNMDQIEFAHANVQNTITTVAAMKEAGTVLQAQMQLPEMDIDAILDMQDDMSELLADTQEINEVLGQDYGIGEPMDDDELFAELDALEGDMASDMSMNTGGSAVPSYLSEPVDPGPPLDQPVGLDAYGLPAAPSGGPMPSAPAMMQQP